MRTWGEVKAFLYEHRTDQQYQMHVIQWNMSNQGCLVDNATDEVLAHTVTDAVRLLRSDDDGGRTRIGNTPTCEDCGEALDHCTCDHDPQPQGETDRYQEMRAKLYMHQHPEATFEEALRIVNSR